MSNPENGMNAGEVGNITSDESVLNETLQTAGNQANGMNTEEKGKITPDNSVTITRRDFLRFSLPIFAAILLNRKMKQLPKVPPAQVEPYQDSIDNLKDIPTPKAEKIHNVDVYGAGEEKITSPEQILKLYKTLDEKFEMEKGIRVAKTQDEKIEQRKEILNPNERYLEVVIRQSGYDSFLERKESTQVDFVEWIQMHVDAMNRCTENAKPPCKLRTVLRRIVVVDDDMPKGFWDEQAFREQRGYALDAAYRQHFIEELPLDTDACWAIADDYRKDIDEVILQGYFWTLLTQENGGETVFRHPPGGDRIDKIIPLGIKNDSLAGKNGIWLDFGLTHEWLHYLWNLPDEYLQEVHDKQQLFGTFLFFYRIFSRAILFTISIISRESECRKKKKVAIFRRWTYGTSPKYDY